MTNAVMENLSALEPIYTVLCPEHMLFDMENGTWFVEAIRARGQVSHANRPLLSYDFGSFYAKLEQLRSTSFMPGSGGGWTVPLLVVEDRR